MGRPGAWPPCSPGVRPLPEAVSTRIGGTSLASGPPQIEKLCPCVRVLWRNGGGGWGWSPGTVPPAELLKRTKRQRKEEDSLPSRPCWSTDLLLNWASPSGSWWLVTSRAPLLLGCSGVDWNCIISFPGAAADSRSQDCSASVPVGDNAYGTRGNRSHMYARVYLHTGCVSMCHWFCFSREPKHRDTTFQSGCR